MAALGTSLGHVVLLLSRAARPLTHKKLIEYELEGFGIRLNKTKPNIVFKRKDRGGCFFRSSCT